MTDLELADQLEAESCGFGIGHALLMQRAAQRIRSLVSASPHHDTTGDVRNTSSLPVPPEEGTGR